MTRRRRIAGRFAGVFHRKARRPRTRVRSGKVRYNKGRVFGYSLPPGMANSSNPLGKSRGFVFRMRQEMSNATEVQPNLLFHMNDLHQPLGVHTDFSLTGGSLGITQQPYYWNQAVLQKEPGDANPTTPFWARYLGLKFAITLSIVNNGSKDIRVFWQAADNLPELPTAVSSTEMATSSLWKGCVIPGSDSGRTNRKTIKLSYDMATVAGTSKKNYMYAADELQDSIYDALVTVSPSNIQYLRLNFVPDTSSAGENLDCTVRFTTAQSCVLFNTDNNNVVPLSRSTID